MPATISSLGPQGFPKKLKAVHKYVTSFVGTAATNSEVRQFTCNGLYDPDISGVGHQVLYFDQLSGIYNHYTVFRSTCIFKLIMTNVPCMAISYIEDDTTVATGSQAAEMSTSTATVHSQLAVRPTVLTRTWVGKEFFGGDLFDNDLLTGSASANPTEQMYFTFVITSMDGVTAPAFTLLVEVIYEAVWDELKTIAQS